MIYIQVVKAAERTVEVSLVTKLSAKVVLVCPELVLLHLLEGSVQH